MMRSECRADLMRLPRRAQHAEQLQRVTDDMLRDIGACVGEKRPVAWPDVCRTTETWLD